jgi:hypothetical protein
MAEEYIRNPTTVMQRLLRDALRDEASFWYGRLAMALEVITLIKTLEEVPGTSLTEAGRQETVSTLVTFLRDQGFDDVAYKQYEVLNDWRKLKFEPSSSSLRASALQATDDVDGHGDQRPR